MSASSYPQHPIIPAALAFSDQGVPWSADYGDVYHSQAGAFGQAEHVFLRGNDLPAAWRGKRRFVVLETGFGLGLNFLALWRAWRADPQRCTRLHFVSVEKHPLRACELARAHAACGAPAELSAALVARWPVLTPGIHRRSFDAEGLTLTLGLGDAAELLRRYYGQADAIFLDGFAPARNPEMWSDAVFQALAARAHGGTTLATWSVAAAVRQGLERAGFLCDKAPGYGGKRDMLVGRLAQRRPRAPEPATREALVLGAGLAGCAAAERLAARGWSVRLLEAGTGPARGASGNLAGVLRPQPSLDDNRLARISRAGYLHALDHLAQLAAQPDSALRWGACGVLHLALTPELAQRQAEVIAAQRPPPDYLAEVSPEQASALAGWPLAAGGWWYPGGAWIQPASLCAANLARHAGLIETRYGVEVARLVYGDGRWQAWDARGGVLDAAPVLVLATGAQFSRLCPLPLPLRPARGQVSHFVAPTMTVPRVVLCGEGYVSPPVDGLLCVGASFIPDDVELALRTDEAADNRARLHALLPGLAVQPAEPSGRAGLRAITPDRLPIVGGWPRAQPGLALLGGFGARGLVWATLAAELLASQLENEPLPLERELAAALAPRRFPAGLAPAAR